VAKGIRFASVLLSALSMAPALAHLLELPAKSSMPVPQYMVVQQIYRGWALLGIVIYAAIGCTAASAILVRRQKGVLRLTVAALACQLAAQLVFWVWTFPANRATANWTVVPDGIERLRTQWEGSHAAGAVLNVAAVTLLVASLLRAPSGADA
jgi:hypothetical protein